MKFELPGPVNLRRTVGPAAVLGVGTMLFEGNTVWRSCRTPNGPATLRVTVDGAFCEAQAWGDGADWMLAAAPALLGAEDEPESFEPHKGLVRDLHRRNPHFRIAKTGRVFEALVPAILGQKVTTAGSKRSLAAMLRALGEQAPGPTELMIYPRPDVLAHLPYYDFHPFGIEKKRALAIREVSRRANRLEKLVEGTPVAAADLLCKLPGIGPWTAALVTGAAMGDADAVPVGDYHIPNIVAWALAGEDRATDARMLELLRPFAGHRGRAIALIKGAGISAPKYGPKNAPRSIAGY